MPLPSGPSFSSKELTKVLKRGATISDSFKFPNIDLKVGRGIQFIQLSRTHARQERSITDATEQRDYGQSITQEKNTATDMAAINFSVQLRLMIKRVHEIIMQFPINVITFVEIHYVEVGIKRT